MSVRTVHQTASPNAFPLNRSISFVFFTWRGGDWKSTRGGFHESNQPTSPSQEQSKERARWRPCESGLDWRRAGGTLHTQVQRERFPTCKPPTDTQRQNWSSPTHLDLADSCVEADLFTGAVVICGVLLGTADTPKWAHFYVPKLHACIKSVELYKQINQKIMEHISHKSWSNAVNSLHNAL